MRNMATLQDADTGSIMRAGADVLHNKEAMRRVLGYLPPGIWRVPSMSAEELLDHFSTLKDIAGRRERQEIVGALLH